jgi:uncharacterized protein
MAPTSEPERYEFLDVLRGAALFGIVTANMILYSLYLYLPEAAMTGMSTWPADRVLDFLELTLIEGKFFTIFSVLFGIGFSVLLTRAKAKATGFYGFFLRRMLFLYLIGVAHAVLFWHADILQFYALCGALLLPFVTVRNRTIALFAVLALIAPALIDVAGGIPEGTFSGPRATLFERFGFTRDARINIWTTGSPSDIVRLNLSSWFGQLDYVITSGMIFKIYGCFLLGFLAGRNEIHKHLPHYRPIIRKVAFFGIAAGIPLNVLYAMMFTSESWLHTLTDTVAILPLSAGYASLLCLMWMGSKNAILSKYFAPVGRMALTNYVGQSVICTLIFYGTGLGLGGTVGPTLYLPIGFVVYLVQIATSRLWLSRFQFGPLEWLWRMLTYGAWVPLTKRPVSIQ